MFGVRFLTKKIECIICRSKEIIPDYTRYHLRRINDRGMIQKTPLYFCAKCYVPLPTSKSVGGKA